MLDLNFDYGGSDVAKIGDCGRSAVARRNEFLVEMVESLSSLTTNERIDQLAGMKVSDSKLSRTEDGSRQQLDLTLQGDKEPIVAHVTIQYDSATHLPQTLTVTGKQNGQTLKTVSHFEYLDTAPVDVYAIGVPKDATLIDRIPSTEVKYLVAGVAAGRRRFDDYKAIVLKSDRPIAPIGTVEVLRMAKKGNKLAYLRAIEGTLPQAMSTMSREQIAVHLSANDQQLTWYPVSIIHDQTSYSFDVQFPGTGNGKPIPQITAFRTVKYSNIDPNEFIAPAWYDYPHLAGRPPLGVGGQDISAAIATEREDGPEDCVLLQIERSGRVAETSASAASRANAAAQGGSWIRANRDFLVMQNDIVFGDDTRQQFVLATWPNRRRVTGTPRKRISRLTASLEDRAPNTICTI